MIRARQPARGGPGGRYFRLMARFAALLAITALMAAPAAASGARVQRHVWATIDECRVAGANATVGVLASMPGGGKPDLRMFAKIQLQYRDAAGRWRALPGGGTGNLALGKASRAAVRGTSFGLESGADVTVLRARVSFAWRRGRRTVVRRSALTSARRPTGRYARPQNFSVASCRI